MNTHTAVYPLNQIYPKKKGITPRIHSRLCHLFYNYCFSKKLTASTWRILGTPRTLKWKSERFNYVSLTSLRTQRFGLAVSFRRFPSSFYESYPMGGSIYFYFADTSARTSSDTTSTWCVCGNRSTGWTFFNLYPNSWYSLISRAMVATLQEI